MDMELQHFSTPSPKPPIIAPPGHLSTELTGFSDPGHYQIQRMLGEDRRRFDTPVNGEWPSPQAY
ncbi:hypothetical protein AL542_08300 [Grimontia hollisae]|uniref:Uncharacterized protein n=1 Tax=Grimontia hollisae CIP 101886 TaxID=675812 RepID=D0I3R8_GRIHO|nr:hypothetical protein [Grimontia hollisae]AMG30384.1 hypothetical protein AL542_08300 [Grimontia hollisae]EEY73696.1 hypothetical protein VHA_000383 [Grimontia hollisae CIP 101886]MDF2185070.1 hypothetical protein [Grimontia hollisae]STO42040.1 Uncharacterised protein [Grimontia hollisae]STQ77716.1 Uncharacterised protein [Grimontia hollisae]